MNSLIVQLSSLVAQAFVDCGFDRTYGDVTLSKRPDLGQFQCTGPLAAAKQAKLAPRLIAQQVATQLQTNSIFAQVTVADPGFINLTMTDVFLVEHLLAMAQDERHGHPLVTERRKIIVDYGGANVAKPMHVGHLRAGIIGESIKRVASFIGHDVLGDVHLGDWGLQMGMVISELTRRYPDWPYFQADYQGPYPADSPVSMEDLDEIYPAASALAKSDPAARETARLATAELQSGRPGYRALWQHFYDVSIAILKQDYGDLNVHFDLWLGESDTAERVVPLIERLERAGHAYRNEGALIIEVAQADDTHEVPPLMLVKSDGAILYGTTDLATIEQRVEDYAPDLVLYVVDKRQSLHFEQLFRAAYKTAIASPAMQLEHIGFGTMNGKDGKPFKTREGGVLKLRSLINLVSEKAKERLAEVLNLHEYSASELTETARIVGVATLKYADLMNNRAIDYVFDLDRFLAFEGRTGPYLLYTVARTKSILRKASEQGLTPSAIATPVDETERSLLLKLTELSAAIDQTFEKRAPNHLCEFAFGLATTYNSFYHQHHILNETDKGQQAAWLALSRYTVTVLEFMLDLLGIECLERM